MEGDRGLHDVLHQCLRITQPSNQFPDRTPIETLVDIAMEADLVASRHDLGREAGVAGDGLREDEEGGRGSGGVQGLEHGRCAHWIRAVVERERQIGAAGAPACDHLGAARQPSPPARRGRVRDQRCADTAGMGVHRLSLGWAAVVDAPIAASSPREVLGALVERSIRLRAKRSLLGAAWPAVAPILLLLLYVFVFKSVFRVDIPRYAQFLFTGLLPWTFLAQALPQAVSSISGEPELVRRSRFAYELLPVSTVLVVGLYFLLTLLGMIVYLAVVGQVVYSVLPALVLPVVALFFFVSSIAMLLALIDVYNHDLRMVLGNILTVWFFLVPIVYRPGMTPPAVRFLRSVDPMNMIVGQFRDILHFGQLSRPLHAVLMLVVCTGLLVVSRAVFRTLGRELPKDI